MVRFFMKKKEMKFSCIAVQVLTRHGLCPLVCMLIDLHVKVRRFKSLVDV